MTTSDLTADCATHVGTVRTRNEDAIVSRADIGLWAVADGAGGHGFGDVASAAVAVALDLVPDGLAATEMLAELRTRLAAVHEDLQAQAAAMGEGQVLATTVVAFVVRDEHYACLWAGDSRAYLLRDGAFSRLTRDHSLVQEMVDAGTLAEEAAEQHPQANVILRAVGAEGELVLDKVSGRIETGDVFLLCSDGLFKALSETDMALRLANGASASELVEAAVANGARDNVSVVALRSEGTLRLEAC